MSKSKTPPRRSIPLPPSVAPSSGPPLPPPAPRVSADAPEKASDGDEMVTVRNLDRYPRIVAVRPKDEDKRPERSLEEGIAIATPKTVTFPMATKTPTGEITPGQLTLKRSMWDDVQRNLTARVLIRKGRLIEMPAGFVA